ncbi:hypothetical protein LZ30DRAFT_688755 [Colletotrichum cereale]|nr:hypothetical protein LZ30DRAFT_688755 [Colletotrichum cereale]
MSDPCVYPGSSTTPPPSLCQLDSEAPSLLHLKEEYQARYEANRSASHMKTGAIHPTETFTDRSRHGKHQSFQPIMDTIDDKKSGENENTRSMVTEISVHLDDNADGYYCCGCGIRRSDEHHRVRKFRSGDPAWRNFCKPCHAKHLESGRDKTMKAYDNFCFGCGFARSSHFNKEHPINQDQRPVKNFCAHCMKQVSRKALIPTETLLGSSSDESDSEFDGQQHNEDDIDGRNTGQETHLSVSHHQTATVLNIDAANNTETSGNTPPESSPSEFVVERLRNRRSARISRAMPPEEDHSKFEWPKVNGDEGIDETPPATCIKNRASVVDDVLNETSNRSADCSTASGTCKLSSVNSCRRIKRSPDAPSTPEASITARDSSLEAGSSLLTSDPKSPSKRATFSERVEVRTSPTYWQREHSEGDGPYAQFRHEHYHEELREGQKAVPLEDPLKDPDGQSAGQLHLPRYSIDDESFNSWSAPGAGRDAFAAPGFSEDFSSNRSSGGQPHPSSLYTSKGYSTMCDSGLDVGPSDFGEMRPNPSNRQHQLYSDYYSPCDQGKENQPCPADPVASEGSCPPFSSFGDHSCPGKAYQSNWSSRYDGPRASHADPPWWTEDPDSNYASHSAQNDKYPSFSDSFSGDHHFYQDSGFNATFSQKDQEAIPDDRGIYQGSSDSDFARQRYFQPRYSRNSDRQWDYHDTESFGIHEDFKEFQPRFARRFPGHSADQGPDIGHDTPYDTDTPFEYLSTSKGTLNDTRLPCTGFAMEIPDDMSDSDVHNLLIPGYDNYVPWRKTGST